MAGGRQVEQEIDGALAIAADRLAAMVADMSEAELRDQAGERLRIGTGNLDELEAVEADRVLANLLLRRHGALLSSNLTDRRPSYSGEPVRGRACRRWRQSGICETIGRPEKEQ